MSATVQSQITIDASPERVWSVLTDFTSYPAWNPFVKSISGTLQQGAKLSVRIAPAGGAGMSFKPVIIELREFEALEWLGHLLIPGIFDGRHRFELTRLANGATSFTQREHFSGILIPLLSSMLKETEHGFMAFNDALKARSETT